MFKSWNKSFTWMMPLAGATFVVDAIFDVGLHQLLGKLGGF